MSPHLFALLTLALLTTACTPPKVQDSETGAAVDSAPPDPVDTSPPDPIDQDSDGFTEDVDCDDRAPSVYPGAEERWNDVDDDCDGVIDGDGGYSGSHALTARATYEGVVFSYSLQCPVALTRSEGVLAFTVTCSPDLNRLHADILLGETVTITVKESDQEVEGDHWEGRTIVASSSGWDTWGDGEVQWPSLAGDSLSVQMTTALDTFSLKMEGTGGATRD